VKPMVALLLVDDDRIFSRVMATELERRGFAVTTAETGALAIEEVSKREPAIVLLDLRLPDMDGLEVLKAVREKSPGSEVIMLTGHGSIDTAIESVRAGAFDYIAKPCPLEELEVRIQRALERQSLRQRANLLERGLTPPDLGSSFIGDSPAFRKLLQLIERVAPSDSTVLITGETGSGKEMVAKLIHARSARHGRPFVVVECAALQEELLQSELFGHERGSFTGAERAKSGLFEVAAGGTIFLDEIGEVSPATQVKLLRVLDTSTFRHVGGTAEIHVDVRVVAATNRDLAGLVRQGLFREDLFYRLSTITVTLPALRERREDLVLLAEHFVSLINDRYGFHRRLGPEALEILGRHDWPGNVRELLHVIEASMVVGEGPQILPEHLPAALRVKAAGPSPSPASGDRLPTLQEVERTHIERVLHETHGHRGQAASILGISERNLYRKLREYGLLP
jgi:two-component system, NtrC family, response regulator AtoC